MYRAQTPSIPASLSCTVPSPFSPFILLFQTFFLHPPSAPPFPPMSWACACGELSNLPLCAFSPSSARALNLARIREQVSPFAPQPCPRLRRGSQVSPTRWLHPSLGASLGGQECRERGTKIIIIFFNLLLFSNRLRAVGVRWDGEQAAPAGAARERPGRAGRWRPRLGDSRRARVGPRQGPGAAG